MLYIQYNIQYLYCVTISGRLKLDILVEYWMAHCVVLVSHQVLRVNRTKSLSTSFLMGKCARPPRLYLFFPADKVCLQSVSLIEYTCSCVHQKV